jgi:hypothetical protein
MKTVKILLPIAALFMSAFAFGQKSNGKANGTLKVHEKERQSSSERRDQARITGTMTSNTHASARAKSRANENAAFDDSRTNFRTKTDRPAGDKRKKGRK